MTPLFVLRFTYRRCTLTRVTTPAESSRIRRIKRRRGPLAFFRHGLLRDLQISRNYVRSDHLIVCSLTGAIWIVGNMGIAFSVRFCKPFSAVRAY